MDRPLDPESAEFKQMVARATKLENVRMLWVDDWYDGPITGVCEVGGEICYFERTGTMIDFNVYRLSPAELQFVKDQHAAFIEHVGTTFLDTEPPSKVKPDSEHHKFYEDPRWHREVVKGDCIGFFRE